jgi:very-short-patch-repair endonuclease
MDTKKVLERLRTRLLDLTLRNRLLNFRYSAKSVIRVIDEVPSILFAKLISDRRMVFAPIPEPQLESYVEDDESISTETVADDKTENQPKKIRPPVGTYARELGINTSYELLPKGNGKVESKHSDSEIQTLLYPDDLEGVMARIYNLYRTGIEETGNNLLYITFGSLEYYDSDDSSESRHAPLVLLPVDLVRESPKDKRAYYEYFVSTGGSEPAINLTLTEKLKRDFGLTLPQFNFESDEDGDSEPATLDDYFEMLKTFFKTAKPRWSLKYEVNLATLSFGKLMLFKDLHPDSWPDYATGIANHSIIGSLCQGKSPEDSDGNILFAKDFALDDLPSAKIPPIIFDADSSQHSALIEAINGKNLVIEGPPGTGKSQTITNLIGAALGQGKTILFVAEKLAALEVVKKRMDKAGLGDFCLELHSKKVQKKAVLESLSTRLNGSYPSANGLQRKSELIEEKKNLIKRYVDAIKSPITHFPRTYFECVGRYSYLKVELEKRCAFTSDILSRTLHFQENVDETGLQNELQKITAYFHFLESIRNSFGSVAAHPWFLINLDDNSDLNADAIISVTQKTFGQFEKAGRLAESLPPIDTRSELFPLKLFVLADLVKSLSEAQEFLKSSATAQNLGILQSGLNREKLFALVEQSVRVQEIARTLSQSGASSLIEHSPTNEDVAELKGALTKLGPLGEKNSNDLESIAKEVVALIHSIDPLQLKISEIKKLLEIEYESTFQKDIEFLSLLEEALAILPTDQSLISIAVRVCAQEIQYKEIKAKVESTRNTRTEVSKAFQLVGINKSAKEILEVIRSLKSSNWLSRIFKKEHRDAWKWYVSVCVDPKMAKATGHYKDLHLLLEYYTKTEELDHLHKTKDLLGELYKAADTNFESIDKTIVSINRLCDLALKLELHSIDSILATPKAPISILLNSIRPDGLKKSIESAVKSTSRFMEMSQSLSMSSAKQFFSTVTGAITFVIGNSLVVASGKSVSVNQVLTLNSLASEYRKRKSHVDSALPILEQSGIETKNLSVMIDQLKAIAAHIDKVGQTKNTSFPLQQRLTQEFVDYLRSQRGTLVALSEVLGESLGNAKTLGATIAEWAQKTPVEIYEKLEFALSHPDSIHEWIQRKNLKRLALSSPFSELIPLFEENSLDSETATLIAEFVFMRDVLSKQHSSNQTLSTFEGFTHEQARLVYQELDREIIELTRADLAKRVGSNSIPRGVGTGPRSQWTELSLIKNEIDKTKRHIPIRQLINRSRYALLKMKPCFMMSPLSVAQFLPPGKVQFDLVIMDEASQLRPEDAFGAVARGGQLVVVGDTKQLPPSSFFDSSDDETAQVDGQEEDWFESILQQAAGVFRPARRLKWHYRSLHESLIAFSNSQFYQNELVLFPTPYSKSGDFGIKLCNVPKGMYDGSGKNMSEALAVVKAVQEHARNYPQDSLGVVTMNSAQREIIDEAILNEAKSDPILADFIAKEDDRKEKFFVKNLENVQGDERDAIFISVTYGRDQSGNFYHRFGPINHKDGWRRLNVLFSRSKKRMNVFCSFEPGQLDGASSVGAQALQGFLHFAQTGKLPVHVNVSSRPPDSPFEIAVATVLRGLGFEVDLQIGVAGYFIDLAIRNPAIPGEYVLGVECDGATYHSSKSARDRDRLRQQNLENLGWKIHRIWSADWFKNEKREVSKLKDKLEALIHGGQHIDPSKPISSSVGLAEVNFANIRDQVRRALIDLREQIIKPSTPSVPSELGILRKSALDEIVITLPLNVEELSKTFENKRIKFSPDHEMFIEQILSVIRRYRKLAS